MEKMQEAFNTVNTITKDTEEIKTNNLLNFIHTETLQGREFTRLSSFLSSLVGGQKEAG